MSIYPLILALYLGAAWVDAAKTITISSPSCNLTTVVEIPTTKCCCPVSVTPTPPTTTTRAPPTSSNKIGCLRIRSYNPPACTGASASLFPGSSCQTYYRCTGVNSYILSLCDAGKTFSIISGSCVPVDGFGLCCKP